VRDQIEMIQYIRGRVNWRGSRHNPRHDSETRLPHERVAAIGALEGQEQLRVM
jgi:hypothetical protein